MLVVCAGTHTEVGKTWVGAAVLGDLRARGRTVAARKPAQSFDPGDDGAAGSVRDNARIRLVVEGDAYRLTVLRRRPRREPLAGDAVRENVGVAAARIRPNDEDAARSIGKRLGARLIVQRAGDQDAIGRPLGATCHGIEAKCKGNENEQ